MYILLAVLAVAFFGAFMAYSHWRAYERRMIHEPVQYEDCPRPGHGYVLANLVLLGFAFILGVGLVWRNADVPSLMFGVLCFYLATLLHACYATRYSIHAQEIVLRSGLLARRIIALKDIESVARVPGVQRVLGWNSDKSNRGFGNRTTNGVSFTANSVRYFLTPSDPQTFVTVLNNAIKKARESAGYILSQ